VAADRPTSTTRAPAPARERLVAGSSFDREAGEALLELGTDAISALRPLLDDLRPAPLAGSEESTLAYMLGLRRADFARHYLARILAAGPSSTLTR
jgi:hypothetical protein